MMNIREEFSGHKVEGQEQKLVTLSKQSIPALSTKQFLESGSLEGVSMRSTRSRQRKDQQLKRKYYSLTRKASKLARLD